ncbi:mCG115039, isoform CRA_b, partial [Mus musculus]
LAGSHDKPFLYAWPSYVVPLGQNVTLTCDSHRGSNIFKLYKEEGSPIPQLHETTFQKSQVFGPVTTEHAGTYRCFHPQYANVLSAHSEPLKIIISGVYKKPSLSVLMGPVLMMSGETMTLSCISDHQFDMFHMSREGVPQGQGMPGVQIHSGKFEAKFLLSSMIQKGNYRCYGSFRNSSHVWSSPSDPLYLPAKG